MCRLIYPKTITFAYLLGQMYHSSSTHVVHSAFMHAHLSVSRANKRPLNVNDRQLHNNIWLHRHMTKFRPIAAAHFYSWYNNNMLCECAVILRNAESSNAWHRISWYEKALRLRTKADSANMCRTFSDVDRWDYFDHELDDEPPVVDPWGIGIPYAAGIIDYEWYVEQTRWNTCFTRCK